MSSLEDNTKAGRALRLAYPSMRDALLKELAPSFAITRQALATPEDSNLTQFSYKYQLPTSPTPLKWLGMTDVDGTDYRTHPFLIEGSYLYCDLTEAYMRYVYQETSVLKFPEAFISALYLSLAAEIAYHITGNVRPDIAGEAVVALGIAKKDNAIQTMTNRRPSQSWASIRRS